MRIELEINEEQMKDISEDLKKFLDNLTDEQKLEILKDFCNRQLEESLGVTHSGYYYNNFSDTFAKKMQEGINNGVADIICKRDDFEELLKDKIDRTVKNMGSIIEASITKYIAGHIFMSKDEIMNEINHSVYMAMQPQDNY